MRLTNFDFVQAASVRRAVVPAGDIREDVAFQNDINGLLARFEGKNLPLTALGWIQEPVAAPELAALSARATRQTLRMIRGGLGLRVSNDVADPLSAGSLAAVAHSA